MISMDKQYVTRDGREVRIYAVDGGGTYCVHGAIKSRMDGLWYQHYWKADGDFGPIANPVDCTIADLIEVKPKITRTYWLLHWLDYDTPSVGESREYLEKNYKLTKRRAITGPHTVEFTEGEGL